MGEVPPWAGGGCRAVDTLGMPSWSHRCHGGQGGKRIPEVPLTRARVNPRPSSCVTFLSMVELRASWGVVGLQGSPLGLRTSKGSQTDLRGLPPGCRALSLQSSTQETGQELNDGIPCPTSQKDRKESPTANKVQRWLRVSGGAGGTQHPGHRCGTKGPRSQKPASGLLGAPS